MNKIEIVQCGITAIKAEAIVNATNEYLFEGGGVCGVIFRKAGSRKLADACAKLNNHCDIGKAVITLGFDLCPYIIHAVGPRYVDGLHHENELLQSCYLSSLALAKEYNLHSIVFPLISAGIFGFPYELAFKIALDSCKKFVEENEDYHIDIYFAIPEAEKYQFGVSLLTK